MKSQSDEKIPLPHKAVENKNCRVDNHNPVPHQEYSDREFGRLLGIDQIAGDERLGYHPALMDNRDEKDARWKED